MQGFKQFGFTIEWLTFWSKKNQFQSKASLIFSSQTSIDSKSTISKYLDKFICYSKTPCNNNIMVCSTVYQVPTYLHRHL